MNISVNNIKTNLSAVDFKADKGLIFSFISICTGLISGAVITEFFNNQVKEDALAVFLSFFTEITDKSKAEIFSGIATEGLIYFLALFICGSNVFGKELSLFFTAVKSAGISSIITALYSQYGLRGFEYCLLVFMPGKSFFLFSMLYMTKCSYVFSKSLRSGLNGNTLKSEKNIFAVKSAVALTLMLISWTADFLNLIFFNSLI